MAENNTWYIEFVFLLLGLVIPESNTNKYVWFCYVRMLDGPFNALSKDISTTIWPETLTALPPLCLQQRGIASEWWAAFWQPVPFQKPWMGRLVGTGRYARGFPISKGKCGSPTWWLATFVSYHHLIWLCKAMCIPLPPTSQILEYDECDASISFQITL